MLCIVRGFMVIVIENSNFASSFVCVLDLVANIEGGKVAERVVKYGVEENNWTYEG